EPYIDQGVSSVTEEDSALNKRVVYKTMGLIGTLIGMKAMKTKTSTSASTSTTTSKITWCFVAGTLVKTPKGLKTIESLEVDDEVITRDEETGEILAHRITETFHSWAESIYDIKVNDEIISTTGNHRFWLPKKNDWLPARELRSGDYLLSANSELLMIESTNSRKVLTDVYNLEVNKVHNYFVGLNQVLVHNGDLEFSDFNQARNAALNWLEQRGFKAEKQNMGKFGDTKGMPIGMTTADGRVGFRIEFDERSGAHINVFDHNAPKGQQKGPHYKFNASRETVYKLYKQFFCK
ncbi:MAG: polymorphic toxin-type HINT domain-containing protein, partial [Lentisphaeraceae bacterium]|nr:polymorphic toxin-type HINT domain-containing protein [Lentisphaeraceae bacterium]